MIVAGVSALLAPLASRGLAHWNQHRMVAEFIQEHPAVADSPAIRGEPGAGGQPEPPSAPERVIQSPAVSAAAPIHVDRSQGAPAYLLAIPGAGIREMVMEGIEDQPLSLGPGHYPGTPLPGEAGNAAIAGHRTVKGSPSFFYTLNALKPGDPILVTYPDHSLTFTVESVFLTNPYDLSVLAPTAAPALTLTTCDPPGRADRRLIVRANLDQVTETRTEPHR
jgi:sortase A